MTMSQIKELLEKKIKESKMDLREFSELIGMSHVIESFEDDGMETFDTFFWESIFPSMSDSDIEELFDNIIIIGLKVYEYNQIDEFL